MVFASLFRNSLVTNENRLAETNGRLGNDQHDELQSDQLRCENTLSFWEERRRLNRAVFDWCLRNAERWMAKAALEKSLQWALRAAHVAHRFPFGEFASPALEELLLRVAKELPVPSHNGSHRTESHERWLHVTTEAYPTGGHTAAITRWIELDGHEHRQSVALLDQENDVPTALRESVHHSGGEVLKMDPKAPLVSRAILLREACTKADVVVLHLFPWEVIPVVALGVCGGPPVLLMNIADHEFWVGGSVADVVLNLRESAEDWIVRHRGIRRIKYLPIPLSASQSVEKAGEQASALRVRMRKALDLPLDATVIFTSGDSYKFRPLTGLNFFDAARAILTSCPGAYLLAVGPREVGEWKALRQATGGRVRAVGLRTDVPMYRSCADMYLEGFPFGSNTAFLEACMEGLPCVRAPRGCLPQITSDGMASKELEQPVDVSAYVRRAIELIADKDERRRCGNSLAAAVRERHTGSGWLSDLRSVEAQLPLAHSVYHLPVPEPIPKQAADFWTQFLTEWLDNADPLGETLAWGIRLDLAPKPDALLMKALRSGRHVRGSSAVHETVAALVGPMLSLLPAKTSSLIYDKVFARLSHDGRIMRMYRRVRDDISRRGCA